ncbi:MAG: thiol:disulfide interchange protein, partial [Candidatus Omnitrophica bacterium]|nr:thiol:disulfide interchange protein [Candidatus Omnitrophota bacterium]
MKKIVYLFSIMLFALLPPSYAAEPEVIAHTTVELMSDTNTAMPGSVLRLAVSFSTDKDWHVYWKNPGDSGLAPTIKWEIAPQVAVSAIHWPIPQRISVGPLMSYGYENGVFLIVSAHVPQDWPVDKPIEVTAKIDWLACKIECIPGSVTRHLTIAVNQSAVEKNIQSAQRLDQEQLLWPRVSNEVLVQARNLEKTIDLNIRPQHPLPEETELYFFPDREDLIDHPAQQTVTYQDNAFRLAVQKSSISVASKVERLQGIMVSSRGWGGDFNSQGIVVDVPLEQGAGPEATGPLPSMTLWAACVFAFLGGMILNLMPCVLPVLSLKVLSLVKNAHNRRIMITHGLLFSFGVLTSFWILAAILILLKSAGHQIGWGFQFQSPYFVVFMAALLYLLALNLLGVFEFVPIALSGEQFKKHPYGNSFFNGVLATTLATPCTAPFMGAALGYALTQTNLVAFLIFTCLGIGMSFPYVFLSAFPQFLQWVPKPGSWMNNLKVFLGFVLMGSVVWLVWVLGM